MSAVLSQERWHGLRTESEEPRQRVMGPLVAVQRHAPPTTSRLGAVLLCPVGSASVTDASVPTLVRHSPVLGASVLYLVACRPSLFSTKFDVACLCLYVGMCANTWSGPLGGSHSPVPCVCPVWVTCDAGATPHVLLTHELGLPGYMRVPHVVERGSPARLCFVSHPSVRYFCAPCAF